MELSPAARCILKALYTARALPGTDRGGCFTWNTCQIITGLAEHGLVKWREIPHRDGEILAQLTERGVKSYLKGLEMGVYDSL